MSDQQDRARTALDVTALESTLLGGERRFTRAEVAERSGIPVEEARRLWRAMGFADVGDDAVVFTDGDVDALRLVGRLNAAGLADERSRLAITRAMGQALSRLAEAQLGQIRDVLRAGSLTPDSAVDLAAETTPLIERLMLFVWRRQIAASAGRLLAAADEMASDRLAVGFADLVGFTSLTRAVSELELAELLDRFESLTADLVVDLGGRIIKTVGDEVLFVCDDPVSAALTGLRLVDAFAADEALPDVRVGLAYGTVLSRLGDVYGAVVNVASRLTGLARPASVLADRDLAETLDADPRFTLRQLRRQSVRGYEHLAVTVVRWAKPPGE